MKKDSPQMNKTILLYIWPRTETHIAAVTYNPLLPYIICTKGKS